MRFLVASTFLFLSAVSHAAPNIAVYVEGSQASTIRGKLIKSLGRAANVTLGQKEFAATLREVGRVAPLGKGIYSKRNRVGLEQKLQQAAAKAGVQMVVVAHVMPSRRNKELWILAVSDQSVEPLIDRSVRIEKRTKKRRRKRRRTTLDMSSARRLVLAALRKLPAQSPEPTSVEQKEEQAASDDIAAVGEEDAVSIVPDESSSSGDGGFTPYMELAVGYEAASRRFRYVDPITSNLRPYTIWASPFPNADIALYPRPRSLPLGLVAGYGRALGIKSTSESSGTNESFSTDWQRWYLGARYEFSAGPLTVGGLARYRFLRFSLTVPPDLELRDEVPNVRYGTVDVGADASLPMDGYTLHGGLYYSAWFQSKGKVSNKYFERSSVGGLESYLGGTYRLTSAFSAEANLRYTHIYYDMKPEVGDAYIAGGALDQYFGVYAGIRVTFGDPPSTM